MGKQPCNTSIFYLNFLTFLAALHFYLLRMTLNVILLHQRAEDRDMMIYIYSNSRARTVYHGSGTFHVTMYHESLSSVRALTIPSANIFMKGYRFSFFFWTPCTSLEACTPLSSSQPKFSIFHFSGDCFPLCILFDKEYMSHPQ